MLQIAFSNRFERLLDSLLQAVAAPPPSPFAGEEVIVPSAAIRRRIELSAADRFGICSNVRFSFLAQWLWRQIGHVVDVSETSPFTTPVLTWRVFAILGEPAFVASHPRLAAYLRRADEVMRYELASRTAALLEQYLTYRPDWLAAWLDGRAAGIGAAGATPPEDESWQAALWQRIARDLGTDRRHPSVVFFEAMGRMGPAAPARAGLPARAHVFCVPDVPPLYLDILQRLGQWIDLRLYVVNPCREYWVEAVDARRLSYLVARQRAGHHETGNRLLAAWGKQTQAHIDLLFQQDSSAMVEEADFVPTEGATLLQRIQNAILDMTDPPRGGPAPAPDDRSLEVHVCHSLTRELEVLHDQLLMRFAAPDPPRPSDVLVVTPDLESAAPLIDAVFDNAPRARWIPYAITGRPQSVLNPCARALLELLSVATSRFAASAVFELLQQPIIGRRFGLDAAALETVHGWMQESGIRWGIDARHRADLGLPAVDRHSLEDGLDRLFLGYALPAASAVPVNGRLAAGDPEGSQAQALGSLRQFVAQLARLRSDLGEPRSPAQWRAILLEAIDTFIAPVGDEIDDERQTRAAIGQLQANMERGGLGRPLEVDVVRAALRGLLDDPTRGGVPTGSVTFAAMGSLRQLPHRIVCVLGLDDGAFPSTARPVEFDLMAQHPRRGDRQRRIDERNLFLDLLLAARERFYLSYTGRSVRDNSVMPPSVLIDELLDYAAAAIEAAPPSEQTRKAARERLTFVHPLQPFSPAYFEPQADPRLRSFNEEYCDALRQQLRLIRSTQAAGTPPPAAPAEAGDGEAAWEPHGRFFQASLAPAGPEFRDVTLEALQRFFRNPCQALLRDRLGLVLPRGDEELQDEEPFVPDYEGRRDLADRLLPRLLQGESLAQVRTFARAGIEYPAGRLGELELEQELQRLAGFARDLAPALAEPRLPPFTATLQFAIGGEPWRLTGGFGDVRAGGRVRHRYDDARAGDYLNAWIEHLFLNAAAPPGAALRTTVYARDGCFVLAPQAGAREHLAALLALYRAGMQRPVHFFPKTSWTYVRDGGSLPKAAGAWYQSAQNEYGESRHPAYGLALRGVDDPLDGEFVELAARVFGPLLRNLETGEPA